MHLDDEVPVVVVLATHIDDGVLLVGTDGYQLRRPVLDVDDFLSLWQGEQGIEEADE